MGREAEPGLDVLCKPRLLPRLRLSTPEPQHVSGLCQRTYQLRARSGTRRNLAFVLRVRARSWRSGPRAGWRLLRPPRGDGTRRTAATVAATDDGDHVGQ